MRIGELEQRVQVLLDRLTASDEMVTQLQLDLADAQQEQRRVFLRGMAVGAGGTAAIGVIIWLVSALTP